MNPPASAPKTAIVLAAGLGTRLRPLTEDRPKAMVEVAGKALIDHMLDRLVEVGVTRAVVNVHAFAGQLEAHLKKRSDVEILISDERARPLETGGGVKKARALLGEAPIWVANCDYIWIESGVAALRALADAWDPAVMDACLIVVPKERTLGFDTPGDFFIDSGGLLTHRGDAKVAPLHCFGIEILNPQRAYEEAGEAFSLFRVWMRLANERRLRGLLAEGVWMQIGDPAALETARDRLAAMA